MIFQQLILSGFIITLTSDVVAMLFSLAIYSKKISFSYSHRLTLSLWVLKKELQQRDFFTSVQFPQAMANDTDFHNTWHYSKHEGSTKALNFVQNPPTFIETSSINFLKRKNNLSPASPSVIFVN